MFNISSYFQKFKKLHQSSLSTKDSIKNSIKEFTKIDILNTDITIKEFDVVLKTSPVFRNEISMNRIKIEENLKSKGLNLNIRV